MARFLSAEWFDQLCSTRAHGGRASGSGPGQAAQMPPRAATRPELVIELVVAGAPDGSARYQVALDGEARVRPPSEPPGPAQVRFISDYETVSAIAAGRLSTYDALLAGRARVSGSTAVLSAYQSSLAGLDLVPAAARAATTF